MSTFMLVQVSGSINRYRSWRIELADCLCAPSQNIDSAVADPFALRTFTYNLVKKPIPYRIIA